MASNTATAVATTVIGAACGLLGGLALGNRSNQLASEGSEAASPRQSASATFDASAIESSLAEVQRGLAELKSLVAGQASSSDRTPVVADSPASTASQPAASSPDQDRLKAIELELAAIRQTIKEQVWVQSPPTLEQLRMGPQTTLWSECDRFAEQLSQARGAAQASVLGLSYDEVLSRFGRPTTIQATKWWYSAEGHKGFNFNFVSGFVGGCDGLQPFGR